VVLQGSLDPWISYDAKVAQRMKRTSMAKLEWHLVNALSLNNAGSLEGTQLLYSNLYPQDVAEIERYLKARKVSISLKRTSPEGAIQRSTTQIISLTSPRLETIVDWALTWSDNLLSERVARAASEAAGNTRDDKGVEKTFKELLESYNISSKNLIVKDGSGLSRENRLSAFQVAQLLLVIARDPKFAPLVDGLPVGGISGTLTERFIDTAPGAVGLVRAKTGTLNGTTNLAGYIESENHQYIFVVIADQHSRSYTVTKKVRATVDRILGKIAKPLLPELIPPAPSSETVTTTNP
jgi:D-alanyl-D-alanine carboxypeptidase